MQAPHPCEVGQWRASHQRPHRPHPHLRPPAVAGAVWATPHHRNEHINTVRCAARVIARVRPRQSCARTLPWWGFWAVCAPVWQQTPPSLQDAPNLTCLSLGSLRAAHPWGRTTSRRPPEVLGAAPRGDVAERACVRGGQRLFGRVRRCPR